MKRKEVSFSHFLSYNKCFNESNEGTSNYCASGYSLEDTTLVASPSQNVLEKPSSPITNQGSSIGPYRSNESSPTIPEVNTGGLFHIKQHYENRDPSQKTIELMLSASPKSTHKTYQSAWKKWDSWCRAMEVDPICSPLRDILHV